MHFPENLGGYPLTLRKHDIENYRPGELLLDYETYTLYYVNKKTGIKKSMAKEIYDRIVATSLQNTKFVVSNENTVPPVNDRKPNMVYFVQVNEE